MKDLRALIGAGALAAVLAPAFLPRTASGADAPDLSGIYWANRYSAKIEIVGGGDLPFTPAGKTAYETNIAPHNPVGDLATLMSAHFCATIPNFRIMEIDIDDVPWKDDLVTKPPVIENGELVIPTGPGWGADIDERVVHAHPPKR